MSEFHVEIRCRFHPDSVVIVFVKETDDEFIPDFPFTFDCGCRVYADQVMTALVEYTDKR